MTTSVGRCAAGRRFVGRGMRGGCHPRRHIGRLLSAAEQIAQRRTDVGGEEAVDQRIGGRV